MTGQSPQRFGGRPDASDGRVAVVAAAREYVRWRRWYSELPPERPLPERLAAALDDAVRALDRQESGR